MQESNLNIFLEIFKLFMFFIYALNIKYTASNNNNYKNNIMLFFLFIGYFIIIIIIPRNRRIS